MNTISPVRSPEPLAIDLIVSVISVLFPPLVCDSSHQSGLLATSHSPSASTIKVCLCSVFIAQAVDGRHTSSWCAAMRLNSFQPGAVWYCATADSGTSSVKLSFATPLNAPLSTRAGISPLQTMEPMPKQLLNAPLRIFSIPAGITIPSMPVQPSKAFAPIVDMLSGNSIVPLIRVFPTKALLLIVTNSLGKIKFPEKLQPSKADIPMVVRSLGNIRLPFRLVFANAVEPIAIMPSCKVKVPSNPEL